MALPAGAWELLIALQTPSPKGAMGIPVLLWGAPGEGKSSFVESLARADFPVLTLIASIHDPTDFSGLPVMRDGHVHFAAPEWVHQFHEAGEGILFLDELTTAPPAVQAALLRIVLERKVGFHDLPRGVRVVAAANPPETAAAGWELSPSLRNRFVHIQWSLDRVFTQALEEGFESPPLPAIEPSAHARRVPLWQARVAGFLRRNPAVIATPPSTDSQAFCSPRTWHYAIYLLASCELVDPALTSASIGRLREGCIGRGAAVHFLEYLKNLHIPEPQAVLLGQQQADVARLRDDELLVLFHAMGGLLLQWHHDKSPDLMDGVLRFVDLARQTGKRADAVYPAVRRVMLAEASFLPALMETAAKSGRQRQVAKALEKAFSGTPLASLIEQVWAKRTSH